MDDQPTKVTHLADLNKQASIDQLKHDLGTLEKYFLVYGTFEKALEKLHQIINSIEKE
jgi:hypothetical protein